MDLNEPVMSASNLLFENCFVKELHVICHNIAFSVFAEMALYSWDCFQENEFVESLFENGWLIGSLSVNNFPCFSGQTIEKTYT